MRRAPGLGALLEGVKAFLEGLKSLLGVLQVLRNIMGPYIYIYKP